MSSGTLRLRLAATSANLGPGFDSVALALAMHLELESAPAERFSIEATGYAPALCSRLENNLLLTTYQDVATAHGAQPPALAIRMHNGIPLGMGCGSSAATRLAAVALACCYGNLGWSREQILAEAVRLEGHPDNASACWLGGFVVSATCGDRVHAISLRPPAWHALLVIPPAPLATHASRRLLPERYNRRDLVFTLQRVGLLTAAFSSGQAEVLQCATADVVHQPFRAEACPLLNALLPTVGRAGILSVTLSGAGPAVLLLLESEQVVEAARRVVAGAVEALEVGELVSCALEARPASYRWA